MSRIICLLIVVSTLLCVLCACGNIPSGVENPSNTTKTPVSETEHTVPGTETTVPTETECSHEIVVDEAVEAGCITSGLTEGSHCDKCGEILIEQTTVEPLGHTTTTGTCTRCGTSFGSWDIAYYVDEFNEPTNDGYVYNKNYIIGTFSNSATTDSNLNVTILADGEDIAIFLYEYGYNQVKNSSSQYVEEYDITMKTADGTKHSLTGTIYCGGDRLFIDEKYESTVLKALNSGEKVSFYIVLADRTTTTYLFSAETNNFAEMYDKLG